MEEGLGRLDNFFGQLLEAAEGKRQRRAACALLTDYGALKAAATLPGATPPALGVASVLAEMREYLEERISCTEVEMDGGAFPTERQEGEAAAFRRVLCYVEALEADLV